MHGGDGPRRCTAGVACSSNHALQSVSRQRRRIPRRRTACSVLCLTIIYQPPCVTCQSQPLTTSLHDITTVLVSNNRFHWPASRTSSVMHANDLKAGIHQVRPLCPAAVRYEYIVVVLIIQCACTIESYGFRQQVRVIGVCSVWQGCTW